MRGLRPIAQRLAAARQVTACSSPTKFAQTCRQMPHAPVASVRCSYPSSFSTTRFFSDQAKDAEPEKKEEEKQAPAEEDASGDDKAAAANEEGEAPPSGPSVEEELQAQIKDLKDQLLRSLAEQENIRNIAKRDVSNAKDYSVKSFAKSILDVSDNLSRAMEAVPADALDKDPVLKTLFEGIQMTDTGLTKALESNGVSKFTEEPGEKFDPTKHEALFEYPDPEKEAGTVGQVMKCGFMLNKRVLRPAEVGVVKAA